MGTIAVLYSFLCQGCRGSFRRAETRQGTLTAVCMFTLKCRILWKKVYFLYLGLHSLECKGSTGEDASNAARNIKD